MGITKTLGGDRIGSGKQMKVSMHGYNRSTHNLSRKVQTAMSCGTLVPIYCKPALNGDNWEIKLDALVKTIPTVGPLFGSFKFQVDFYKVPIRLYQGILHNNPLNIGLNMNQVYLPKLKIEVDGSHHGDFDQVSSNALLRYLGFSGVGQALSGGHTTLEEKINAVPALAYYDIFKNYYANKQENMAYVLTGDEEEVVVSIERVQAEVMTENGNQTFPYDKDDVNEFSCEATGQYLKIEIDGKNLEPNAIQLTNQSLTNLKASGAITYKLSHDVDGYLDTLIIQINDWDTMGSYVANVTAGDTGIYSRAIKIQGFTLANIDTMRMRLLSSNTLGAEYVIDKSYDMYPYSLLTKTTDDGFSFNVFSQNGLCLKTYQSDIFNNWLKTEWIDGENGIAAITAIDTSSGSFTLDALNLSQKIYNMMNRIAVGGGTYEDWQEAVYDEKTIRKAETPMYIGGMSSEIAFQEVVATSETLTGDKTTKLGTLAGKGVLLGKHAGHIKVRVEEPCFIIGIASITPRISYYQGNEWYMTQLNSIDDLHKPELDGIGFQDLLTERMAYWDAQWAWKSTKNVKQNYSAGKQPAWMEYMTDVDVVFSDFADNKKAGYMVLKRDYKFDENADASAIEDLTTYIDPSKYNLAFAYQELDAQNFWVQLNCDIKCRRKMSARIIPNL